MRKRAPKNLTIDLGGDLLDSLTEWSSRRDNNKSFDDWTEFWRAKELSMLHHAPYILDNCPKNILLSIYDILAAELSSPALRIGAVFALYTFYHTQPEPLHATKQRALGKDEIDWRVQIPITPTNATHLLQLRRQLVEEQRSENEDLLEILRRLADCVEMICEPRRPPLSTAAARPSHVSTTRPQLNRIIHVDEIVKLARDYEDALSAIGWTHDDHLFSHLHDLLRKHEEQRSSMTSETVVAALMNDDDDDDDDLEKEAESVAERVQSSEVEKGSRSRPRASTRKRRKIADGKRRRLVNQTKSSAARRQDLSGRAELEDLLSLLD